MGVSQEGGISWNKSTIKYSLLELPGVSQYFPRKGPINGSMNARPGDLPCRWNLKIDQT